jgi:hypothetical protein
MIFYDKFYSNSFRDEKCGLTDTIFPPCLDLKHFQKGIDKKLNLDLVLHSLHDGKISFNVFRRQVYYLLVALYCSSI